MKLNILITQYCSTNPA